MSRWSIVEEEMGNTNCTEDIVTEEERVLRFGVLWVFFPQSEVTHSG